MCGRMVQTAPVEVLRRLFGFTGSPNLAPRYNLAPTQEVAVVRDDGQGRVLVRLRWGLVPPWAGDPSGGARLINARSETVADKPSFRAAIRHRRCLVPVDGFYEWQAMGEGRRKQPYVMRRPDHAPFALAGLWERWTGGGADAAPLETLAVLTTTANGPLSALHDRMPVILDPADWPLWLDAGAPLPAVLDLLRPAAADALEIRPVSPRVGSVGNDDPSCLDPIPLPQQPSGHHGQTSLF